MTELKDLTVGVIGGGLMGHGIALTFARAGCTVKISDPSAEVRAGLRERIRGSLLAMGGQEAEFPGIDARLSLHETAADAARGSRIIFEAAPEKIPLKQALLAEVAAAAGPGTILCSNTSVIPITTLAQGLTGEVQSRLLGTHWWNPPHLIPLVEVVPGAQTDPGLPGEVSALLRAAGKTPVQLKRDVTGFIGNRLQAAMWREAIYLVESGVCEPEMIDTVVTSSFGRRLPVLGPMANLDLIGADLGLDILGILLPELDNRPEPSPLLRKMVAEGQLGMKTGTGFQTWDAESAAETRRRLADHLRSFAAPEAADADKG